MLSTKRGSTDEDLYSPQLTISFPSRRIAKHSFWDSRQWGFRRVGGNLYGERGLISEYNYQRCILERMAVGLFIWALPYWPLTPAPCVVGGACPC